jgi:hypothetical protein
MAIVHWINSAGGSWQTGSNWSSGSAPATTDDVIIDAAGTYTVTVTQAVTVNSLQTIATVTVDVTGTSLTLTAGTGTGANAGTIIDDNASTLYVGGTINNSGTIKENSTTSSTSLRLQAATTTLIGHGKLTLSDSGSNFIYGNLATDALVNANNTISGAGQLGDGQMTFVNEAAGIVDATSATLALVLNTSGETVVNSGLLESTNAGGLYIYNTLVNDTSGGTISAAGAHAIVELGGGTIQGGTLITSAGGLIETVGGNGGLDGTLGAVTNKGTVAVTNGTNLYLAGTISNAGTISEGSTGSTTNIILSYPVVTLTGSGHLTLSNNINNRIYGNGSGYELINVNNVISGAGQIATNQMVLVNETGGTINANQSTQIILNTPSIVTNQGLMEATSTGGLLIQNTTVNNAGGTIAATGTGAHVDLGGGTIEGGTLTASSGGIIDTVGGNGALDGITSGSITLLGTLAVENATTLYLAGTIDNTGTIAEGATVNTTTIRLNAPSVTLTGGGALTLSNSDNNYIYGNSALDVLINVNNVISGTGQLGDGQMTLVNEAGGIIDANNAAIPNLSSGVLVINCNAGVTNAGLIEDTNTAGLTIYNTGIDNLGGTVTAIGAGSIVNLNGATIEGGTITDSAGGIVNVVSTAALDGSEAGIGAITNAGSISVLNSNTLYLYGVIDNTGTIGVNSAANTTELRIGSPQVMLEGSGTIAMSDNANNYIFGNVASDVLVNVNNKITGAGQLGNGNMTLLNETAGVIDANQSVALTVNCNDGVTNIGLMEGTSTGGLVIVNTAVNNLGGTIEAVGAGALVDLSGAVIEGGTLKTATGGIIYDTSNSTLDGYEQATGAVTNAGSLVIINGTQLTLDGTINNTGTILVDSAGSTTELRVGTQLVTLQGGGALTMTDNANNYLFGNASVFELDNVNNTISGAGQLGNGQMELVNTGKINANGTNALVVNLGSYSGANSTGGLMEATGTGGMALTSGIFSNSGTMEASASTLSFGSSAFNLNTIAGTLTGGTWEAAAGGTLAITGGAVTVDAANIVLSGATSVFEAGNGSTFTALGTSLGTVAAGGSLSLASDATLVVGTNTLSDSGAVSLSTGATLAVTTLLVNATGSLKGVSGIERGNVTDNGTVTAGGNLLDVSGRLSGTGVLNIDTKATAEVGGALTVASVVFATGTETLQLGTPAGATSVISGFATNDAIDLLKTTATTLTYAGTATSGTLTVDNGTTAVATLKFNGNYTLASFKLTTGSAGATITGTGSAPAMHFLATGRSSGAADARQASHGLASHDAQGATLHDWSHGVDAASTAGLLAVGPHDDAAYGASHLLLEHQAEFLAMWHLHPM